MHVRSHVVYPGRATRHDNPVRGQWLIARQQERIQQAEQRLDAARKAKKATRTIKAELVDLNQALRQLKARNIN